MKRLYPGECRRPSAARLWTDFEQLVGKIATFCIVPYLANGKIDNPDMGVPCGRLFAFSGTSERFVHS